MEVGPSWTVAELERAREYHRRQMWADGGDAFRVIDSVSPLAIDDLARLIECTYILGRGDAAARAVELGNRCGDPDLVAVAAHIQGRARIKQGGSERVWHCSTRPWWGVTAGETSAGITSWVYCSVIDACHEVYEVHRAREWTLALNAWCDARPQYTGAFSGVCRIHRSELLQLGGVCRRPRRSRPPPGGSAPRYWLAWLFCCITSSSMPTICRHWPSSRLRCWVGRSFLSGSRKSSSAPMRPHRLGSASCP